jgi:hypothetical protein
MKIGDKVNTPDGIGTIKDIEFPHNEHLKRYGVLHDVFPANRPRIYPNDILYYPKHEVQRIPKDNI